MTRFPTPFLGLLVALGWAASAEATSDGLVFEFLQPGSACDVGLGGDPFRTDIEDATGWWGDFVDLPGDAVAVEAFAGRPLAPSVTGGWVSVSSEEITTRFSRETDGDGFAARFAGWIRRPESVGRWEGGRGDFRIEDSSSRAEGGVRVSDLSHRVTLQGTAPFWIAGDRTPAPAGRVGVRLRPWSFLRLQADAGRAPKVQEFAFDLEGETGSASLNAWVTDHRLVSRLELVGGVHAGWSIDRNRVHEIRPIETAPLYRILPYGGIDLEQADLGWSSEGRCRLLYRWTRADAELEGEAYWSYERFGDLTYARFDLESHLVAAEARFAGWRLIGDAERARAHGTARAKVEYWPFTEAVIDLFGPRRTYKATGDVRWYRFHGGLEKELHRDVVVRCGLSGYDIRPELRAESWSPAVLVFGRADIETSELDIERVSLGALSLGAELSPSSWLLRLEVQQLVFARVSRRSVEGGRDSGVPGEAAEQEEEGDWKDGGRLRLSVAYLFR